MLYRFHQTFPVLTDKEKEWQSKLEDIAQDVVAIKTEVEDLQLLSDTENESADLESVKLRPSQLEEIKEEITNQ